MPCGTEVAAGLPAAVVEIPGTAPTVTPVSGPVVVGVPAPAVTVEAGCGPRVIEAARVGPQGPPGRDGDKHYTHPQPTPATVWTVQHNLNKRPSVAAVDSAGTWWIGAVRHLDENTLTVTFSAAFAGEAYCN